MDRRKNLPLACHPPQSGWNCGAISCLLTELCVWILKSINLLIIESTRMNALSGDECAESLAGRRAHTTKSRMRPRAVYDRSCMERVVTCVCVSARLSRMQRGLRIFPVTPCHLCGSRTFQMRMWTLVFQRFLCLKLITFSN